MGREKTVEGHQWPVARYCELLRRVYANLEPGDAEFRSRKPKQPGRTNSVAMGSFVLIRDGSVKSVAVTWDPRLPFGYDDKPLYINCLPVIPQLEPQVQNGT